MQGLMLEHLQIVEGFPAVDLSDGANTGDWLNLRHAIRAAVVFRSGVGTAGDDPTLVLKQAKDKDGTSSKALPISRAYKKQAATSLAAVSNWRDAAGDVSSTNMNQLTNATSAEQSCLWVVEVDPADLDDGFTHIQASVADVGTNAQPGDLLYLVELRERRDPAEAVSVIH